MKNGFRKPCSEHRPKSNFDTRFLETSFWKPPLKLFYTTPIRLLANFQKPVSINHLPKRLLASFQKPVSIKHLPEIIFQKPVSINDLEQRGRDLDQRGSDFERVGGVVFFAAAGSHFFFNVQRAA